MTKPPTPDAAMIERATKAAEQICDILDINILVFRAACVARFQSVIVSLLAAERALGRAEAFEEAEKIVIGRINRSNDCELLGSMDPETGAYECSMEIRSGDCLCAEHVEEAEEIRRLIRARKDAPPKPVTAPEETPNG